MISTWQLGAIVVAALIGGATACGWAAYRLAGARQGWSLGIPVAGCSLFPPILVLALGMFAAWRADTPGSGDTAGFVLMFFLLLDLILLPVCLVAGFAGIWALRRS